MSHVDRSSGRRTVGPVGSGCPPGQGEPDAECELGHPVDSGPTLRPPPDAESENETHEDCPHFRLCRPRRDVDRMWRERHGPGHAIGRRADAIRAGHALRRTGAARGPAPWRRHPGIGSMRSGTNGIAGPTFRRFSTMRGGAGHSERRLRHPHLARLRAGELERRRPHGLPGRGLVAAVPRPGIRFAGTFRCSTPRATRSSTARSSTSRIRPGFPRRDRPPIPAAREASTGTGTVAARDGRGRAHRGVQRNDGDHRGLLGQHHVGLPGLRRRPRAGARAPVCPSATPAGGADGAADGLRAALRRHRPHFPAERSWAPT